MNNYQYITSGTCSKLITLVIDDEDRVQECNFLGGCNGNLQGIGRLVKGERAQDIIKKLKGISCNGKPTSCPDQLAQALQSYLAQKQNL
ncbi:MAG: TIGR03905 family TSCPD domain-containing protein [Bacteroidaceae bacterium]|nr:TIGR03905 family TSCPD domain-containing protein [Bacteroidaceae bacterium]